MMNSDISSSVHARHSDHCCRDKHGKTCVRCVEKDKRQEKLEERGKRVAREAEVSAALAARVDTQASGKVRWADKLLTVNELARTEANRVQQAPRTLNDQAWLTERHR